MLFKTNEVIPLMIFFTSLNIYNTVTGFCNRENGTFIGFLWEVTVGCAPQGKDEPDAFS